MKTILDIVYVDPEKQEEGEDTRVSMQTIYPAEIIPRIGEEILLYEDDPAMSDPPRIYLKVNNVRNAYFKTPSGAESGAVKIVALCKFVERVTP